MFSYWLVVSRFRWFYEWMLISLKSDYSEFNVIYIGYVPT